MLPHPEPSLTLAIDHDRDEIAATGYPGRRFEAMNRYFLHIHHSDGVEIDDKGIEVPSLVEAQEEAARLVRETVQRENADHAEPDGRYVSICDVLGRVLDVVAFKDVQLHGSPGATDVR